MPPSNSKEARFRAFAVAAPELTVLSDLALPSTAAHLDSFDLRRRVGPVYDIIRHPDTRTPMTIAIFGDWGSGKTSAMRWLMGLLDVWNQENKDVDAAIRLKTVWFDPWKYDNKEDVWRGLVSEVILASLNAGQWTEESVRSTFADFGAFLGGSFIRALKLKVPGVEFSR
jgi:predicted KAP-like P-loop ATPase